MTEHKVGTREEWLTARTALLAEEKQLTRRSDELAQKSAAGLEAHVHDASATGKPSSEISSPARWACAAPRTHSATLP